MSKPFSTAEVLAIAVLQNDQDAILPLIDCLLESWRGAKTVTLPVKKITTEMGKVRVIIYVKNVDDAVDKASLDQAIRDWLETGRTMVFTGVDRVEVYELG